MDEGLIIRGPGGKFLPGTRTPKPITKETSHIMHQKRQEKTARLLREKIKNATAKVSSEPITNSAAAVAEAGSLLWEEIVLAPPGTEGVYPRDKLEAFVKLGTIAGIIPHQNARADSEKNNSDAIVLAASTALTELLGFLREANQPREVIEGKVNDTRTE